MVPTDSVLASPLLEHAPPRTAAISSRPIRFDAVPPEVITPPAAGPWDHHPTMVQPVIEELRRLRPSPGMARSADPDSANSQFFIMFAPAPSLDGGYTIFGRVIRGMDVADRVLELRDGSLAEAPLRR